MPGLLDIHLLIAESVAHPLYMASVLVIACRKANSEFVSTQFCYRFALLFDRDNNISLVSFRIFSTFTLPCLCRQAGFSPTITRSNLATY